MEDVAPVLFEDYFLEQTIKNLDNTKLNKEFFKSNKFLVKDILSEDININKMHNVEIIKIKNRNMFLEKYADIKIGTKESLFKVEENSIEALFEDFYGLFGKILPIEQELLKKEGLSKEDCYTKEISLKKYISILKKIFYKEQNDLLKINNNYKIFIEIKDEKIKFYCDSKAINYVLKMIEKKFWNPEIDLEPYLREIVINKILVEKEEIDKKSIRKKI